MIVSVILRELLYRKGPNIKYTVRKLILPLNPFIQKSGVEVSSSASASEAATVPTTTASSTEVQPRQSILLQADVHPTPHQPLQGTVTETPVAQHMRSPTQGMG